MLQAATHYESGFPKSIIRERSSIPVNDRLRFAREKKKLTLTRAAEKLNKNGVSCAVSTLQSYEAAEMSTNRRLPSLKMLISLSNLYDCSTDFLLGLSDEPNRYTPDLHSQIRLNSNMAWKNQKIDKFQEEAIILKVNQIMAL